MTGEETLVLFLYAMSLGSLSGFIIAAMLYAMRGD